MVNQGWIQEATRAVILSFTIYIPSVDQWISNVVLIEISTAGAVFPTKMTSRVFRPDVFESDNDKIIQGLDVIRYVLTFYILYLLIRKAKNSHGWYKRLKAFFSFGSFLDIFLICCSHAGFAISYRNNESGKDLYEDTGHVDVLDLSINYQISLIFYAIFLLLIFIRIT
jgi:hypothetical protein